MDFKHLLETMVQKKASDLYLLVSNSAVYRIEGRTATFDIDCISAVWMDEVLLELLSDQQKQSFEVHKELNFSYMLVGERFRCNLYIQRGLKAMVIRHVTSNVPTISSLGLPEMVNELADQKSGLVLVTGPTGSGKSTTLAAMLNHRVQRGSGHVVTIEDPIEYYFNSGQMLVSQREIGIDTESYPTALRSALRQAPDIVLIGEMLDRETVEMTINFSETGHLVMSTLHATNATQAIQRILQFFEEDEQDLVCLRLSLNLKGVLSQRLLPKEKCTGRVLAYELMVLSARIRDLIVRRDLLSLKKVVQQGQNDAMFTLDECLLKLYREELISRKVALSHADSPNNLELRMKGFESGSIYSG